jgi:hypothetical protein
MYINFIQKDKNTYKDINYNNNSILSNKGR